MRWLPRVLGIVPLAALAHGLWQQGGTDQGIPLVITIVMLCIFLLIFYTLVTYITIREYCPAEQVKELISPFPAFDSVYRVCFPHQPNGAKTDARQRTLRTLNRARSSLEKYGLTGPSLRKLHRTWRILTAHGLSQLLRTLTTSATPFEACNLSYSYGQREPEALLDLTNSQNGDLVRFNTAIRMADRSNYGSMNEKCKYRINILSINNTEATDGREIPVQGGKVCVSGQKAGIFTFIPDDLFRSQTIRFPYKIELLEGERRENQQNQDRHEAEYRNLGTDFGEIEIKLNQEQIPAAPEHTCAPLQCLSNWMRHLNQAIHILLKILLKIRVQVAIALLTAVLLNQQQTKDVLLTFVLKNRPVFGLSNPHFFWAVFTGTCLGLLLWHTSRQLLRLFPLLEKQRQNKDICTIPLRQDGLFTSHIELLFFWLAWISLVLFTVPIVIEAFAPPDQFAPSDQPLVSVWVLLSYFTKPYLLFLVGALLFFCWRYLDKPRWWRSWGFVWFLILFVTGLFAPLLLRLLHPLSYAQWLPDRLGSIAILFWGMVVFLIVGSTIYQFGIRSGFPLLSILLVAMYALGVNRINDNHQVRLYPSRPSTSTTTVPKENLHLPHLEKENLHLPHLEDVFGRWALDRRREIEKYSVKNPYPIYVVSAQGGGIYAAYHSAKALAVLSEEVPSFSDHIFAISGVSGGSVGATVFANGLHTQTDGDKKLSERIDQYFSNDHDRLALILSSMLFGNAAQTLFPAPVAAWDRSLGLELGFENRRAKEENNNNIKPIKLDDSFYRTQVDLTKFCHDSKDCPNRLKAPYLVLNTTEVENGRRYIFAPFRIREEYPVTKLDSASNLDSAPTSPRMTDADFHEPWLQRPIQMQPRDIRFSTAAGLSARFPVVSPHGFFPESRSRRLIDGGLYDNSGAVTAKEIMDNINLIKEQILKDKNNQLRTPDLFDFSAKDYQDLKTLLPKIVVYPLAIVDRKAVSLDSSYADPEVQALRRRFKWLGWSAIDAIFSTRDARLQKAVDLADGTNWPQRRVLLQKEFRLRGNPRPVFPVPLGWTLSCQARSFINDQLQPMPKRDSTIRDVPRNQDGAIFSHLPCEEPLSDAVSREPVQFRTASPLQRANSISHPFWELIRQLQKDLQPPSQSPSP